MPEQWLPIEDYEIDPMELSDNELRALSSVWNEQRCNLAGISEFTERLQREWAIETGLIERLYSFDRGITEVMIEHGVNAAFIPHGATEDPDGAVAMIGDQQDAIEGIFAFVNGGRSLSTSYIKELHSLFCRHQAFAEGRDQFGSRSQVPLIKGAYKKRPNNPTRPDGKTHEYCPPEHVAAEMDRLIELHASHGEVAPEVEAAWLHHRFVQIHPFQDGNGRVARALATLVFIKAGWLPLVVRDRQRNEYIGALEEADEGNLKPLVLFFSKLQRQEFVNALGIARDVSRAARVEARIQAIGQRFAQRREALAQEQQAAVSSARRLHEFAKQRMGNVRESLESTLSSHGEFSFFVDDDVDQGDHSHYHQRQIISTAKRLGYFANTRRYRSWVRLGAADGDQSNILVAFHGIGHEFQGVLVCSATWFRRVRTDDGGRETEGEKPLCDEVFQVNYKEAYEDIEGRFDLWLEDALARGLALWESAAL